MRAILQLTMRSVQELDCSIIASCGPCRICVGIPVKGYDHSEMTVLAFCRRLRCRRCGSKPETITISHLCLRGGISLPVLQIKR